MTSFFSDLEDQLRAAAHERASRAPAPDGTPARAPRRRRRWLAGGARLAPVALAVAVTLAIVVGALVLLGHRGGQSPSAPASQLDGTAMSRLIANTPSDQLRREFALIAAASKTVVSSPACHVPVPKRAAVIHGAPGSALLSTLGLLRRPPTAADRLPAHTLDQQGAGTALYAGAARRALTVGHTAYYVVPIRQTTTGEIPSDRCFTLQARALQRALPTMPAALRSPTRELEAASIAYARTLAAAPPQDGICQVTVSGESSSSECGEALQAIQHGTIPGDDNGIYSGVVPDGVASVTLNFPAIAAHAASSVTGTVHDNVYVVHAAAGTPFKINAEPTVVWRGPNGAVIRTITQPGPESLKQMCRRHPESCAPMVLATSATTTSRSSRGKLERARPVTTSPSSQRTP